MTILLDSIALDKQGYVDDSGFWHTTARFARAGIQVYSAAELVRGGATQFATWDGARPVRVLRPESAVFDADSMRTFEHLPLTVEHEGGAVTPDNAKGATVGASKAPVIRDSENRLAVPVVIYDSETIRDAQSGNRKQLSAGSRINIELRSGIDETFGEHDAVITEIRGNHISVVRSGKAGPEFTLGDSTMSETRNHRGLTVTFDAQGAQAYDAIAADLETTKTTLAAVRAENEKLKADRDALQAKADVADSATLPDLDALVAERAALVDSVRKVVPDIDPTGKSAIELKRTAAAKAFPTIVMDGKSDDYVDAMFTAAVAMPATTHDNVVRPADKSGIGIADKARAEFIAKRSGR